VENGAYGASGIWVLFLQTAVI